VLVTESAPHADDVDLELAVGLLGGALITWSRGQNSIVLPDVPLGELSQFIHCRLTIGDAFSEWLQHTPITPPLGEERDRRALARYLDPRTFLRWLRSLLTDDPFVDGGDDWDGTDHQSAVAPGNRGPEWWAPTIEDALKAWNRDPNKLADVDLKVRHYLKLIEEEQRADLRDEDLLIIQDFRDTWSILRGELVVGRR
jgi:hypothetical protein